MSLSKVESILSAHGAAEIRTAFQIGWYCPRYSCQVPWSLKGVRVHHGELSVIPSAAWRYLNLQARSGIASSTVSHERWYDLRYFPAHRLNAQHVVPPNMTGPIERVRTATEWMRQCVQDLMSSEQRLLHLLPEPDLSRHEIRMGSVLQGWVRMSLRYCRPPSDRSER